MIIIGLNAYHGDSSACLLRNGLLVAAAEEERFRRVKHWAGFPTEAIRYCMDVAGVTLSDITHIVLNSDPTANLLRKFGFTMTHWPEIKLVRERIRNAKERNSVEEVLEEAFPGDGFQGDVLRVEHHLAHLSSAFHVSPFDEAAVVSVDGFGDFSSTAWGLGQGVDIVIDGRVYFPHSLGIFYQAMTQYIGFPFYGDEYKVMGLAPYGEPKFQDEMRRIVLLKDDGSFRLNLIYFVHHKKKIEYKWKNGSPSVGKLFSEKLEELLGPARGQDDELTQRHMNIARSVQVMYEEAFFHLLRKLYDRHPIDSLCLAGGCAMNSVANGKITHKTSFKNVYIQSAAGDAGGAIGAAFVVHHRLSDTKRKFFMGHAYWGPEFTSNDFKSLLEELKVELDKQRCIFEEIKDEEVLCQITAKAIADGEVIGWYQGRMEWGPRALGNRSILCDPRREDMKSILNLKIKKRESFRPFAPSILRDRVAEWFEQDDDVPFMMKVFQVRKDKRPLIPAVTHVDGSGRLQTVYEHTNSRYYHLIKAFEDKTGVPIVLNTSFNENEPVVCNPREALECFLRTKMDVLVLGNWFVKRNGE